VEVIAIDKATRKESILDDRKLTPSDNIESRLNGYFQLIFEHRPQPGDSAQNPVDE
jgi:hypothetical protein